MCDQFHSIMELVTYNTIIICNGVPGKGDSHSPPSREPLCCSVLHLRCKRQTSQNSSCLGLSSCSSNCSQLFIDLSRNRNTNSSRNSKVHLYFDGDAMSVILPLYNPTMHLKLSNPHVVYSIDYRVLIQGVKQKYCINHSHFYV